jgi:hypothetical protein
MNKKQLVSDSYYLKTSSTSVSSEEKNCYYYYYKPRDLHYRAAVEFTPSSTVPFIGCFLIRTSNPDSVLSITDLTYSFAMLYYVFDAQLFLQPQLVTHIKQSVATSIVAVETWV